MFEISEPIEHSENKIITNFGLSENKIRPGGPQHKIQ